MSYPFEELSICCMPLVRKSFISLVPLLFLSMFSCCKKIGANEALNRDFDFDFGVYVEKKLATDSNPNRYTADNKIYTIDKTFVFDYYILRNGDTLKIASPRLIHVGDDPQRLWSFIELGENNTERIETISIKVLSGISNEQQTEVRYDYQYSVEQEVFPLSSTSGVIENKLNVWMHPHRDMYFMILELNPFPYIQRPFAIGTKWNWKLEIGEAWGDQRWKSWHGSIHNNYSYEIIGKEKLHTKIGELDCWIVHSKATSDIGDTELTAYFNEDNGFVKFIYTNIDKSKLVIEIKEISGQ